MEEKSPQSKRLQEFVDLTGYSVNEFAKQCLIPSTRTLTRILTDGGKPSPKILDKIIKRFPQLNHDWVVLGYGEMIVKGFENKEVTSDSLQKSTQSSFGNIQESLANHDFSLNELAKRVDKAITRVDTISEFLTNTVQESQKLTKANAELQMSKIDAKLQELDNFMTQMTIDIQMGNTENREKGIELINKLDEQRRKLAQKDFDILFKQFDRLSKKTENHLNQSRETLTKEMKERSNEVLNTVIEAFKLGFEGVEKNSDKRYNEALVKLGAMNKHKKKY